MTNFSSASAQMYLASQLPTADPSEHCLADLNQALMECQQNEQSAGPVLEALLVQVSQTLSIHIGVVLSVDRHGRFLEGIRWQDGRIDAVPQDWHVLLELLRYPRLSLASDLDKPIPIAFQEWLRDSGDSRSDQLTTVLASSQARDNGSSEDEASTSPQDSLTDFQSILMVPLRCQGTVNGLLVMLSPRPHNWSDGEISAVQLAAHHITIAISQVQLQAEIDRHQHHQALLTRFTEAVRDGINLDELYAIAINGLVTVLQVSQGIMLSFKYANPQVKGRVGVGPSGVRATVEYAYSQTPGGLMPPAFQQALSPSSNLPYGFQISNSAVGQSILQLTDSPLLVPTQEDNSSAHSSPGSLADLSGVEEVVQDAIAPLFNFAVLPSLLAMPLTHQGIGLGCLVLQHQEYRPWQPDEVNLVQRIATHLSSALMQANTLRKVQALVEERTAQLRHSLDVQAKLYDSSRQQVEQLKQMNQTMEELLSTVSHELLTPLTSMKMAIKMLREAPLNDEQRDRYLQILEHQCSHETRLIRDLLALQTIEAHAPGLQVQRVDMHALLAELHTIWQDGLKECDLTLVPKLPERNVLVQTDAESLYRILTELLTNAKKYSAPGHSIDIQLDVKSGQKTPHILLTIQNTGLGVLPEELPVIFDKFRRGQQAIQRTIPGIGLGLTLAKGLTSHLRGALVATSTPIAGTEYWLTRFTLTLPLLPDFAH
ncbi:MAG: ATP-binding protein [Cyanobacteria bacterium J06638_20]